MKEIDAFSGLLEGPRARGAFTLRTVMKAPWSLRVEAESPLTVMAMVKGTMHIEHDCGEAVSLGPGDVAIACGETHYTLSDQAGREPKIWIRPGQKCETADGRSLHDELMLGVRTWGNDIEGETLMLVGSYESLGDISERLRGVLPELLWVKHEEWDSPLVALLNAEMERDAPGQAAVLDRLLDMLLIAILRVWLERDDGKDQPWYRAKGDPIVSKALKMIHGNPAHPWSLAALAAKVGVSRAALARRFQEVIGESPMSFLTQWRLALAADLLCEPDETLSTVADRVGYGSPYALSTAFKRVRGVSPQEHRSRNVVGA